MDDFPLPWHWNNNLCTRHSIENCEDCAGYFGNRTEYIDGRGDLIRTKQTEYLAKGYDIILASQVPIASLQDPARLLQNSNRQRNPLPASSMTLQVAKFLDSAITFGQGRPCFLPARHYTFRIRRGREERWSWLDFPNVTARDVMDTCSISPGRNLRRAVEGGSRDLGVDLRMSLSELVDEAKGVQNLMLMVLED
ncbi:hypothetical protein LTR08_004363 [Meristemomyces frigidus]|nr:hypothetical protein LTR08_004363 [Meristemomyces frigidus]